MPGSAALRKTPIARQIPVKVPALPERIPGRSPLGDAEVVHGVCGAALIL